MLSFRLSTLSSAEVSSDVLAAWELAALFLGEATTKDLPLDEDEARAWYIDNIVEEDSQADYRAEPQLADDEMAESFANSLRILAKARIQELGNHYPFVLDENGCLVRRDIDELSAVSACYLLLQFFRGVTGGTLEIDGTDDADIKNLKAEFDKKFRNLFEYIAGYAVASRKFGTPFMTSDCRSAKRLEALLRGLCRKVGAGIVLPYDHWNAVQRAANDGGVDCLIHIGGPGAPGDAEIALVGATVQKNNIGAKIMGPEKVDFFRSFFATQPAVFRGVLVRPQDEDELTKQKCVQKDCLLFSYEQIWRGLGSRAAEGQPNPSLVRLDAKSRKLLREFIGAVFLHEYEQYQLDVA